MLQWNECTPEIVRRYHEQAFLVLRNVLSADQAQHFYHSTENIVIRQVICGEKTVQFGEQKIPVGHPIHTFFATHAFVRVLLSLTHTSQVNHLTCWTSVYRSGEYINAHRDRSGTIQAIVCLHAPPDETYGGMLILSLKEKEQHIFLQPGDAVVFDATTIQHCTTPIRDMKDQPPPKRVVAVGRYYMH